MQDIDTDIFIHTRGEGVCETVRMQLLHFNLQNKWIHRHCYTRDAEEASLWISSFKHVKFSISSILINSQQLQESVQTISSSQLMLESDFPSLSKSMEHSQHAALLTSLKMPLSLFNQLTPSNTSAFYYIPSVLPQQQPHPQNAAKSKLFKWPTIESRNHTSSMEQILHFQTSSPVMSHTRHSHSIMLNKSTNVWNQ